MISAIVVVGPRVDELDELCLDYWKSLESIGRPFELIFVLDGPKAESFEKLAHIRDQGINITVVRLSRSFGESTALMSGFDVARGDIILTLPAYYQVNPDSLGDLISNLPDNDVVIANRNPRRGSKFEHMRRRVFHGLIGNITGMRFSDLGCGVRAIKRRVLEELRLYGDQHRFLAVLAAHNGFTVKELDLPQSPKDEFRARYRVREYLHRLLDIFTVFFLIRFTKKPLRFFGMIGGITFIAGSMILGIVIFERLFLGVALADRPAMLLSSLLVVLGLQLFSLGLLGELIIFTHARSLKEYKIDQIIGSAQEEADAPKSDSSKSAA